MCSPGVTMDLEFDVGRSSSDMDMSESSSFTSRRERSGALGGRMEIGIVVLPDEAAVRYIQCRLCNRSLRTNVLGYCGVSNARRCIVMSLLGDEASEILAGIEACSTAIPTRGNRIRHSSTRRDFQHLEVHADVISSTIEPLLYAHTNHISRTKDFGHMATLSSSSSISHFNEPFISALDAAAPINANDDPSYYARYPRSLITTSNIDTFMTGTGLAIYESLIPLLESTSHELILVTCFWARSATLATLNEVLMRLSEKAVRRGTEKIRVRLCFSSCSIFQKLFHSQSLNGTTYPKSVWVKKLGLPDPSKLNGLDIKIKSIFILPFSVMHPKFIIIDRKTAVLPSCNISWEEWFEGAVTLTGPVVDQFFNFYRTFWQRRRDTATTLNAADTAPVKLHDALKSSTQLSARDVHTVFLPSPHRRNPRFSFFGSPDSIHAPPTPLNAFILTLFAKAEKSIRIQTPNVTAPPVLSALLKALARGIDVRIVTSERLMILEQLVTAGTTTSRCIKKLIKRYRQLLHQREGPRDDEAAIATPKLGRLNVLYFEPIGGPRKRGQEAGEPQQSHLKMTIVDDEVLVLGSGNLDRASWFTSQELGVAFFDKELVSKVGIAVDEGVQGSSKLVFDSEGMQ
jgi:phosphatidylserine/phosphatidylglycerophosphate/cardiolipin synthase-like enzyme